MHLILIIALGIFGGLWLFTQWAEWREARRLRAIQKLRDHLLNAAPYQQTTSAKAAKPVPSAGESDGTMAIVLSFFGAMALTIVLAIMAGALSLL